MGEELETLEPNVVPLCTDSEQLEPLGADDEEDETWSTTDIEVIAEVGEYETTTDYDIRSNVSPMPREAVRFVQGVAQREKLINDWSTLR